MAADRRPVFPAAPRRAASVLSPKSEAVLRAIPHFSEDGMSGASISQAIGIGAGSLYPALADLEERGLVTSQWGIAATPTGPRPRLYALSEAGVRHLGSLPPPRYPENPSPWARLGRWLFDRLTRR